MEVKKQRNTLRAEASSCQSFSNNCLPSGQLQKISIGITVGASPRERPLPRNENDLVLPANEKNVFSQSKPAEEYDVAAKVSSKRKQADVPDQETSARICILPFNEKKAAAKKVQLFENQPVLESGEKKAEKGRDGEVVKELTSTKMQEMHAWANEEFEGKLEKPANTGHEALKMKLWEILGGSPSQKDQVSTSQAHKTETNNLKSQKNRDQKGENTKHNLNSDPIETDSESPDQTARRPVTCSITRNKGLTNYQSRLKHVKSNDHIFHPPSSFQYKQNQQEKNIFSFDVAEAQAESLSWDFNGNARLSKRKKNEKEIFGNVVWKQDRSSNSRNVVSDNLKTALKEKMLQPESEKTASKSKGVALQPQAEKTASKSKGVALQPQAEKTASKSKGIDSNSINAVSDQMKTTFKEKMPQTQDEKTASKSNRIEDFYNPSPEMIKYSFQTKNLFLDEELQSSQTTKKTASKNLGNQSPKKEDHQKRLRNSPVQKYASSCKCFDSPPKNLQQQENIDSPLSLKKPQVDFQSPTFAMNKPTKNDFPSCPSSERMPGQEGPNNPIPTWRRLKLECPNSTTQATELVSVGSEVDAASSDDTTDFMTTVKELSPSLEVKDATNGVSPSSVDEQEHENYGIEFSGFIATKKWPSGTCNPEEPSFMLHRSRKFCNQDNIKLSDLGSPSPSPKGTEDGGDWQGATGDQENSLARAIAQLALALERLKYKIKSQTGKKSSDILASVAERMHLQLQNIESRIQMDVGKFTSLSKAKRKCLESRFQEEQEKLKLIHDKFKNELNQHLQHCRSTIEDLEAYQIELKGNAEKQKDLQRKLLLETEEAIRIQLSDAERSITAIRKASREKMRGLKRALTECLSEFT